MNITWLSNAPYASTGYGNQTKIFVPRIKAAGHEIIVAALYGLQGGVLNWNGIPVFPSGYHAYGQDIIGAHAALSDIMISLMDAWVCEPDKFPKLRWCPWFPIDSEPMSPLVWAKVKQAYHRIAMSKHGCAMMDQAELDYTYVPHGIDTSVFHPVDRVQARTNEEVNLPADAFIVGMVAANQGTPSRKAFCQQIEAFARFHEKRKDTILYIHSHKSQHGENGGVNLPEFCEFQGLKVGKDVFFPDQYQYLLGFPDYHLNNLYNSFDVFMNVSMGEGFGIPIVEAQAAGCPVIVGDWTAMSELCFSGWKIPKKEAQPYWNSFGAYWYSPNIRAIIDRLEVAYHKKGNAVYRERARTGALDYDADTVYEKYWVPTLAAIQAKIEAEPKQTAIHTHAWAEIGLNNPDGTMSVPCIGCNDELIINRITGGRVIVANGYKPDLGILLTPDTDGVDKIIAREIKRDYNLDNLDLKPGDVVLDIGAHRGIVTCYLAKKYPGVKVLAFEPVKDNFDGLTANIKLNNLENVVPLNYAVTNDGRNVSIDYQKGNSGGASIYAPCIKQKTIWSTTLKLIFDKHDINRLALLKIDCEGAEFEILGNADGLLSRIDRVRGEFHRSAGNVDVLLAKVKAAVPDTIVTVQG